MSFAFNHRKTTQALNFFARKSGGEMNKLKALKLVYFADRYHLRRYGRPITGDEYLAMPYGPVASGAKDLAEMGDFLSDDERAYGAQFLAPVDRYSYRSTAEVAEKTLSESDRTAMETARGGFGSGQGNPGANALEGFPRRPRTWNRALSSPKSRGPRGAGGGHSGTLRRGTHAQLKPQTS
jgi:hypothetical protein